MKEYIVRVYEDHTEWYLGGKLHREDGPAIEYADGSKLWYQHGKLHRLDIKKRLWLDIKRNKMKEYTVQVYEDRTEWRLNNQLHREDGPAVEYQNGTKMWYKHGELHRVDGPAVECAHGNKIWYRNGVHHREDGPARIWADGSKDWFLNGKQFTEEEHRRLTSSVRELTVEEIETLLGYKVKIIA